MSIDGPQLYSSITFCPDQSICCGTQNTTCCRDGHGVWIQNGQVVSTSLSSSVHAPTLSVLGSSSTSLPAPTHVSVSSGLTQDAKVGLGVGISVGVILLSLLAYGYVRERRHRERLEILLHDRGGNERGGIGGVGDVGGPPYELPNAAGQQGRN